MLATILFFPRFSTPGNLAGFFFLMTPTLFVNSKSFLIINTMNIKEICLEEIEVHSTLVEETINCLLHTIIFLRHPKKVTPDDTSCTLLAPLTYAKCNIKSIDNDVRQIVDVFNRTVTNVGPNVSRGGIYLSYYEISEEKGFFGLTTTTQKVYFEKWKIPIVVSNFGVYCYDIERLLVICNVIVMLIWTMFPFFRSITLNLVPQGKGKVKLKESDFEIHAETNCI